MNIILVSNTYSYFLQKVKQFNCILKLFSLESATETDAEIAYRSGALVKKAFSSLKDFDAQVNFEEKYSNRNDPSSKTDP